MSRSYARRRAWEGNRECVPTLHGLLARRMREEESPPLASATSNGVGRPLPSLAWMSAPSRRRKVVRAGELTSTKWRGDDHLAASPTHCRISSDVRKRVSMHSGCVAKGWYAMYDMSKRTHWWCPLSHANIRAQ